MQGAKQKPEEQRRLACRQTKPTQSTENSLNASPGDKHHAMRGWNKTADVQGMEGGGGAFTFRWACPSKEAYLDERCAHKEA